MPGWDETQNEYRYRLKDPSLFTPGTFFVKEFQKKPKIYAIFGKLKGEEKPSIQGIRFDRNEWALEDAKKWYKEHEADLKKSMAPLAKNENQLPEIIGFFLKSGLDLLSLQFSSSEFTKSAIEKIVASKGLDFAGIQKRGNNFLVLIRQEKDFEPGSLRDIILREGLIGTFGKLKTGIARKSEIQKRVPDRFALLASEICDLSDLDIVEVTLTASPVVGKLAEWRIRKSISDNEQIEQIVPFRKFNMEKQQVFAYPLVPGIPDFQDDRLSEEEVEKAAHSYLRNLSNREQLGSGTGYEHGTFDGVGYPIESFIDRTGIYGIKGGWWLGTQVTKAETWQEIQKGIIIGYSVGGNGKRKKSIDCQKSTSGRLADIESKFTAIWEKLFPHKTSEKPKEKKTMADNVEKNKLAEKYDLRPSEIEEIEKAGINPEELFASGETFIKAMGLNLNNSGIGYTTKMLVDTVRSGKFGEWPANANASWGSPPLAKSAQSDPPATEKTKDDANAEGLISALKSEIDKLTGAISGMMENQSQMATVLANVTKRVTGIESEPGSRKSVDGTPPEDVKKGNENDNTWSAIEALDVPLD